MLLGYNFYFSENENNSYFFETENGFSYEVKFKPTPYLLSTPELSRNTFEFIIDVDKTTSPGRPPLDRRTSKTISNIFEDFYERFSETITIYVCESADHRQMSRSRKFHIWFEEFNGERYIKYDTSLTDSSGIVYPISILFRRNNPHKHQIFKEFDDVLEGYRTAK